MYAVGAAWSRRGASRPTPSAPAVATSAVRHQASHVRSPASPRLSSSSASGGLRSAIFAMVPCRTARFAQSVPAGWHDAPVDAVGLRRWCLAQSGAVEDFPFAPDVSVFKVAGKMFALSALG